MNTGSIRASIYEIIEASQPHDALEQAHITATLAWIKSGVPLFRVTKPDVPPQHLVAYFVLVDVAERQLLLVDHKQAALWLPSGGHVEPDEHPQATVRRELAEELGLTASFLVANPLFLTVSQTVGATAGHTDVSLWYVLRGDSSQLPVFDVEEFYSVHWFAFDTVPFDRADPHMRRFMAKLTATLASRARINTPP